MSSETNDAATGADHGEGGGHGTKRRRDDAADDVPAATHAAITHTGADAPPKRHKSAGAVMDTDTPPAALFRDPRFGATAAAAAAADAAKKDNAYATGDMAPLDWEIAGGAAAADTAAAAVPTTNAADKKDADSSGDAAARSVYVGQVDYGAEPGELAAFFEDAGLAVNRVTILVNKATGHPKGAAYVEFVDAGSQPGALALNGRTFKGRNLRIAAMREHAPPAFTISRGGWRGGRGGSGRGRGGGYRGRGRGRGRGGYRGRYRGGGRGRWCRRWL